MLERSLNYFEYQLVINSKTLRKIMYREKLFKTAAKYFSTRLIAVKNNGCRFLDITVCSVAPYFTKNIIKLTRLNFNQYYHDISHLWQKLLYLSFPNAKSDEIFVKNKVVHTMAKNSGNKIEGVKGQTIQIFQRNQLLKYDLM